MNDTAIPPKSRGIMNALADVISGSVKPYAFALLVFDNDGATPIVNYISNADRQDMIKAMEEFIQRQKRIAEGAPGSLQ